MELALLIDFGSTYTKVTAVELVSGTVLGTARAFTTVESDIMEGFFSACRELEVSAGLKNPPYKYKVASSSAAGGLKMIAVGLIPELTVEAARRAALGAGARVTEVYAHELTKNEVGKIELLNPDIILLAGGTDGGNRDVILHNAKVLAGARITSPIVVAGNKSVGDEVCAILAGGGKDVTLTENVMPELNILNIEPARETIREVFLRKIVAAKGLKRAEKFIDRILMPTPAAVLKASELLSKGIGSEPGIGELMVIDVGGATTDIYSMAEGSPSKAGVSLKGLSEAFAKRTVEGDLGMRYSAQSLVEAAGPKRIIRNFNFNEGELNNHLQKISCNPGFLSSNETSREIDTALGLTAVEIATERHVGSIEVVYTPFGATYIQTGKDLTQVNYIVGTGGIIVFHENPASIMKGVVFDADRPAILKPINPCFLVDREYIMAAMGLLAEIEPVQALKIMKKHLTTA